MTIFAGEQKEYLISDIIDNSEGIEADVFDQITPKFLNSLTTSGIPNHKLKLKIETPIMLLRNLDQTQGLCNGGRLIITRLANHVIGAKVITGSTSGDEIYISRMSMSLSQSP